MIDADDRNALIEYRFQQAQDTISEVDRLIEIGLYKVAINRIYYGMFYSLTALALKNGFKSSKHLQLIGFFNRNFVKTKILEPEYGRMLRDAYKNRSDGDYAPFIDFELDEVKELREEMVSFINKVKTLLY